MAKLIWAKRPFDYAGKSLDRGQVFEFGGHRNDEKLERLGYVTPVEKKATLHECSACGAQFIGIAERTGHYEKRHVERELTPAQEDSRDEREERRLNEVAPLGGSA